MLHSSFKNLAVAITFILLSHPTSVWAGLSIQQASETRSFVVVATNPSDNACGLEVKLGDGRTERRRVEPKENWQIQHAYAADGEFMVRVEGVAIMRGLRSVGPCNLTAQSILKVVGVPGAATAPAAQASPAAAASQATVGTNTIASQRPQPVVISNPTSDLILFARKDSDRFRFIVNIDGVKRLDSVDRLLSGGYTICFVLYPDAYKSLGATEGQAVLSEEVARSVNALVNNRAVRSDTLDCVDSGRFLPAAPFDLLVVQRQAVRLLQAAAGFDQFQPFAEITFETLSQNAGRRQQQAARRVQDLSTWTADIDRLSSSDSSEKIGSLSLALVSDNDRPVRACTFEYSGMQSQAVRGYAEQLLGYTSPNFRNKAAELRATYNPNQPFAHVYKTIEAFYTEYQRDNNVCHILVTFPKNLKLVMTAIERDRKSKAYEVNELVATPIVRDTWARKQGFADLTASEFASEIQVSASTLRTLSSKGIPDKTAYDSVIAEMKASRYSDSNAATEVLAYLDDKAFASGKPGMTATSVRREREARAEQQARADRERREQEERIRNMPLTQASLDPKITYKYYSDGSCRTSSDERCMNVNQYKQMCGWAQGLTRNVRPMAAVMFSGNYSEFLRSGGSMVETSYRWSDAAQQCRVSFAITGIFNGTNHRKEFSGYASNFIVTGNKEVLIHVASGM
jgi:hypothetical protein